jgi:diketogulonate reductase-like aldo/keto reductase
MLSRREFNQRCAALGLSLTLSGALARGATGAATDAVRTVKFPDGSHVPAIGQGSWHIGQGRRPADDEEKALRTGLSLGMTLIDTSGNYGDGRSEQLIKAVLAGQRDRCFLVTKVEVEDAIGDAMARACEASLARLGTDHLDLYLLHAPTPSADFAEVVAGLERLRDSGKFRSWGVSNFTVAQMEELLRVPHGDRCATNQVYYNLGGRGIERDLLPWCERHGMPVMAYSPLGGLGTNLLSDPALGRIAAARGCSPAAIALAFIVRSGNVIAIPESGSVAHVKENAVALSLTLTADEIKSLDAAHPI